MRGAPRRLVVALATTLTLSLGVAACSGSPRDGAAPAGAATGGSHSSPTSVAQPSSGSSAPPTSSTGAPATAAAIARQQQPESQRGLAGDNGWRSGRVATGGQVEGYANPEEVTAGRPVRLYLSSAARHVSVIVYRMGDYRGGWSRRVFRKNGVRAHRQPAARFIAKTRTIIAPWAPTIAVATKGWVPGAYLAKIVTPAGLHTAVPFFVTSTSVQGRVIILGATQTWEAYNDWGGYSLYHGPHGYADRSYAVSFDRPNPDAGGGDGRWAYDIPPMVQLAESLPIKVAYLTDVDIQRYPHILSGARAIIVTAHAEYLSAVERARLTAARNAGTNIFFANANSVFWRVRLHPGIDGTGPDRLVVGYKDAALDPQAKSDPRGATDKYRNPPDADPEESLTGARYECYPVNSAMVVVDPTWWGFRGTGAHQGSSYPLIVGDEGDRAAANRWAPHPLQILSYSPFSCRGTPDHTTMTYYTTPSGAGVIDTATERWTCDFSPICAQPRVPLASRRFARMVMANVLLQFARGPVGKVHPARNTIGKYDLNTKFPGTGGTQP